MNLGQIPQIGDIWVLKSGLRGMAYFVLVLEKPTFCENFLLFKGYHLTAGGCRFWTIQSGDTGRFWFTLEDWNEQLRQASLCL